MIKFKFIEELIEEREKELITHINTKDVGASITIESSSTLATIRRNNELTQHETVCTMLLYLKDWFAEYGRMG